MGPTTINSTPGASPLVFSFPPSSPIAFTSREEQQVLASSAQPTESSPLPKDPTIAGFVNVWAPMALGYVISYKQARILNIEAGLIKFAGAIVVGAVAITAFTTYIPSFDLDKRLPENSIVRKVVKWTVPVIKIVAIVTLSHRIYLFATHQFIKLCIYMMGQMLLVKVTQLDDKSTSPLQNQVNLLFKKPATEKDLNAVSESDEKIKYSHIIEIATQAALDLLVFKVIPNPFVITAISKSISSIVHIVAFHFFDFDPAAAEAVSPPSAPQEEEPIPPLELAFEEAETESVPASKTQPKSRTSEEIDS